MRLSASEVGDDGKSADADGRRISGAHRRSGSGTHSFAATQRAASSNLRTMNTTSTDSRLSRAETMQTNSSDPPEGVVESGPDRFGQAPNGTARPGLSHATQQRGSGYSGQSTSSGEREASFGSVNTLPQQQQRGVPAPNREASVKKSPEELRRRGSVDDRTMTMSAGRLFVANPDLSD